MGKARVIASEFGMKIGFTGGSTFSVVGAKYDELDSSDLLFAANTDALAFISLYHLGLVQNSTYVWLPEQAIEKYLKAYLLALPNYTEKKIIKIGHNLKELWAKYKTEYQFTNHDSLEEYIHEISQLSTDVRYGNASVALTDNLISGLVFFVTHFNKYKKHSNEYLNSYYGFYDNELQGSSALNKNLLTGIAKVYLHLIIEHKITLSPTGICHPHKYVEVMSLQQNRKESNCPFCNRSATLDLNHQGLTNQNACIMVKEYFVRECSNK